jgi:hypothetical protein
MPSGGRGGHIGPPLIVLLVGKRELSGLPFRPGGLIGRLTAPYLFPVSRCWLRLWLVWLLGTVLLLASRHTVLLSHVSLQTV